MTVSQKSMLLLTFLDQAGNVNCLDLSDAGLRISIENNGVAPQAVSSAREQEITTALFEAIETLEFYADDANYKSGKRGVASKVRADAGNLAGDTLKMINEIYEGTNAEDDQ